MSQVLEAIPGALGYVVGVNPHDFQRLRNPFVRRDLSPPIWVTPLTRVGAGLGRIAEDGASFLAPLFRC